MRRWIQLPHRLPLRGILLFTLLLSLLSLLAYAHATHRFTQQLRAYIDQNVLQQTDKAELYSFNDATTQSYLVQEITRNLASLCPASPWQILGDCSAQVTRLKGLTYTQKPTYNKGAQARFTLDFTSPRNPLNYCYRWRCFIV